MSDSRTKNQDTAPEEEKNAAIAVGGLVGGVAGSALGPAGAIAGAAVGGALAGETQASEGEDVAHSAVTGRGPRVERYADPQTDADARNSDAGLTSVGASDTNADTATIPSDQPGVRRGDTDTAPARASLQRARSDIAGDPATDKTGRDTGPFLNAETETGNSDRDAPTSPTPSSSTASLPPDGE